MLWKIFYNAAKAFISEFEKDRSLWNVTSESYENRNETVWVIWNKWK